MARPLRAEYPGAWYHVLNRGLERREVFRTKEDYGRFLDLCLKVHQSLKVIFHAYALLPNHYHLYVETPEANLSRAMRQLDGLYTQGFNRRYKRVGPLFQGRYKAILVDKDSYSLALARYIHLNPVKAGLASAPEGHRWSSYPVYLGYRAAPPFLETQWLLSQFSLSLARARKLFARFTLEGLGQEWEPFHDVQGGFLLGKPAFCEHIKERFLKKKSEGELTGLRDIRKTMSVDAFISAVAHLTQDPRLKRKILIYTLRRFTPLSLKEVGKRVGGMSYQAVAQTVLRLERQRQEDQTLDRLLTKLEALCMSNVKT